MDTSAEIKYIYYPLHFALPRHLKSAVFTIQPGTKVACDNAVKLYPFHWQNVWVLLVALVRHKRIDYAYKIEEQFTFFWGIFINYPEERLSLVSVNRH